MVSNSDSRSRGTASESTPAPSLVSMTKQRVEEQVENQQHQTGSRIDSMARSMHDAVDLFHDENEQILARCMDYAAGQLESVATYLKDRSFRGVRDDAANVARSHSIAFLGLALVGGIALGRFVRSSAAHRDDHDQDDWQHSELSGSTYVPSGFEAGNISASTQGTPLRDAGMPAAGPRPSTPSQPMPAPGSFPPSGSGTAGITP